MQTSPRGRNVCWAGWAGLILWALQSWTVTAAPLRVVATTSMVADLVKQVGGDSIMVEGLMGPGVDPHLYKAGASDV
ncbi:MAG TPA: zinc ABC transporter substrate-binding protein, partial [Opitutaceae bacterium]|nr:zinc ABC transporter substrate-binding protein [Opitutaceae bacterium]